MLLRTGTVRGPAVAVSCARERDRPGRSVQRLAELLVRQIPPNVRCAYCKLVGETPTRAVETTALPIYGVFTR